MMTPAVHVAVQALRDFGARTRTEAKTILPIWQHSSSLSDAERAAVLAAFDGQPWPASIHAGGGRCG